MAQPPANTLRKKQKERVKILQPLNQPVGIRGRGRLEKSWADPSTFRGSFSSFSRSWRRNGRKPGGSCGCHIWGIYTSPPLVPLYSGPLKISCCISGTGTRSSAYPNLLSSNSAPNDSFQKSSGSILKWVPWKPAKRVQSRQNRSIRHGSQYDPFRLEVFNEPKKRFPIR